MRVDRDLLDRFHRTLVREIRKSNPEYFEAPFTVAEIYQQLVPYRTHGNELGVETNGEYEEALMRLLAGEGGYLVLDSEPALRKVRAELENPAPNTGLFREFAAAEVRLDPDRVVGEHLLDDDAGGHEREPSAEGEPEVPDPQVSLEVDEVTAEASPQAAGPSMAATEERRESVGHGQDVPTSGRHGVRQASPEEAPLRGGNGEAHTLAFGPPTLDDVPEACPDCTGELPPREGLRFCPHCGVNVHVAPCPECDADLERSWNFCIYCGASAGG